MHTRRSFLAAAGGLAAAGLVAAPVHAAQATAPPAMAPKKVTIRDVVVFELSARGESNHRAIYVEISTDAGLSGLHGPINKEQAFVIRSTFRPLLVGRDALGGESLWEQMRRRDRHARSGLIMMAISSLDNALWDIRGKYFGVPVYRLLGGPTRDRIRAYASMLGYSTEPQEARKRAREFFDRGFTAQKWFFQYGPADGRKGRLSNLLLVAALREELGDEAELMFDCHWNWDVPYTIAVAKEIMPYRPLWLEEPVHPEQIEGYQRIKRETGIPLASGEHFYTRWNCKPFLDAGILDFLQTDPEWTGGITEAVKICALADVHEVKVVPHGHHVLAAAHLVAAQPPGLCPMIEYLFHNHLDNTQYFQKTAHRPEGGWLALPTEPGLGLTLDESKIGQRRDLNWE
jgi:L-rhamnonate dehydratase